MKGSGTLLQIFTIAADISFCMIPVRAVTCCGLIECCLFACCVIVPCFLCSGHPRPTRQRRLLTPTAEPPRSPDVSEPTPTRRRRRRPRASVLVAAGQRQPQSRAVGQRRRRQWVRAVRWRRRRCECTCGAHRACAHLSRGVAARARAAADGALVAGARRCAPHSGALGGECVRRVGRIFNCEWATAFGCVL